MARQKTKVENLVDYFFELKNWDNQPKVFYKDKPYGKFLRQSKELLILCDDDFDRAKNYLERIKAWAEEKGFEDWQISTVIKSVEIMEEMLRRK